MATTRTDAEALMEAKGLVASPSAWTQGDFARAANGQSLSERDTEASRWCVLGACNRVGASFAARNALVRAVAGTHFSDVADWNDAPGRIHADVLALFDRAIALAAEVGS